MGLLNKLFRRKDKNVKSAIQDINEELFENKSKPTAPKKEKDKKKVKEPEIENKTEIFEEPKVESKTEVIKEPEVENKTEIFEELKIESKTETFKEPEVRSKTEVFEEPKAESKVEDFKEPEVESKTEVPKELKVESKIEVPKEPKAESKTEVIKKPKVKNKKETLKEPERESKPEVLREPEVENKPETPKELELENKSEVIKEPKVESKPESSKEPEVKEVLEDTLEEAQEVLTQLELEETKAVPSPIEEETTEEVEEQTTKKKGFMKRLFGGLSKTRESIARGVDNVLSSFKQIDEELYEELEEALIIADFGVDTTMHIMDQLKAEVKAKKITDPLALKPALQEIITEFLTSQPIEPILSHEGPTVVLVIGVNGVGKTTSIGKLSALFKSQDKRVLVAAADTFRAAAIEQLNVWTERAGVEIIKHSEGADAAAVVYDAIAAAKSRKVDVLICDTAGRLQNKTNLMKELEKISRVIAREYPEAKKEILIVIDATTGQNALQQVKLFKEVADISGIILTKLDGTAKGGAIVSIYDCLKVPVKYIGVGEKIDDLQPFDASAFAKALFESVE